jgi:hypothetical protein
MWCRIEAEVPHDVGGVVGECPVAGLALCERGFGVVPHGDIAADGEDLRAVAVGEISVDPTNPQSGIIRGSAFDAVLENWAVRTEERELPSQPDHLVR